MFLLTPSFPGKSAAKGASPGLQMMIKMLACVRNRTGKKQRKEGCNAEGTVVCGVTS